MSSKKYYIISPNAAGEAVGPFDEAEIARLRREGRISDAHLAAAVGDTNWKRIEDRFGNLNREPSLSKNTAWKAQVGKILRTLFFFFGVTALGLFTVAALSPFAPAWITLPLIAVGLFLARKWLLSKRRLFTMIGGCITLFSIIVAVFS